MCMIDQTDRIMSRTHPIWLSDRFLSIPASAVMLDVPHSEIIAQSKLGFLRDGSNPNGYLLTIKANNDRGALLASIILIIVSNSLTAKPPTLEHIYPSGAAPGSTVEVELIGDFDNWPPRFWLSEDDVTISPKETKGSVTIHVSSTASVGPRLIRCFTAEGASEPRGFIVSHGGNISETTEAEPNDGHLNPHPIKSLPVIVNGRLSKRGDADSFRVPLEAGQWLIADLFAYRLQSPTDALLQIIDPQGFRIAFNHDHNYLDPFLAFQAPASGDYTIQVMGFDYPAKSDVRLGGSKSAVYRLHLYQGPHASHSFPLALQRGHETKLAFRGWALDSTPETIIAHATHFDPHGKRHLVSVQPPDMAIPLDIPVTPFPQSIEITDSKTPLQSLPIPGGVSGVILTDREEDRYQVELKADQTYTFSVTSQAPIHQFDAWLQIENTDGKVLKRDDDSRQARDPKLTWPAKQTGPHILALGNLTGRGHPKFYYHLTTTQAKPDYTANVAATQFLLTPGETNTVTLTIKRKIGFEHPLKFRFRDLPVSIRQEGGEADGKQASATVHLIPDESAPPFYGEVRLEATNEHNGQRRFVPSSFLTTSVNNGVPAGFQDLLVPEIDALWLTVKEKDVPNSDSEQK